MPNQSDPSQTNQNPTQPVDSSVPPIASVQADLPPLPDFQNVESDNPVVAPLADPTLTSPGEPPAKVSQPVDSTVFSTKPKKKFGGGRIIATILGILLLVGGVGAGIIITQQKQLFQQKAACGGTYNTGEEAAAADCPDGYVLPNGQIYCKTCSASGGPTICAEGYAPQPGGGANGCISSTSNPPGPGSTCIGCTRDVGAGQGMHGVTSVNVVQSSPTSAQITWTYGEGRSCPKRGATYIYIGTVKSAVDANCPSGGSSGGCNWSFKVGGDVTSFDTSTNGVTLEANKTYYYRVISQYEFTDKSGENQNDLCEGVTFSPTSPSPSPTPGAPQCTFVRVYSLTQVQLTQADLSKLKAGDQVGLVMATTGSTKAKFTINGKDSPDVTDDKVIGGATVFWYIYTIPPNVTTFDITGTAF